MLAVRGEHAGSERTMRQKTRRARRRRRPSMETSWLKRSTRMKRRLELQAQLGRLPELDWSGDAVGKRGDGLRSVKSGRRVRHGRRA